MYMVWMISPRRQLMCYRETLEEAQDYVRMEQARHVTRNYVFEIKRRVVCE